jgi:hypothetical protein
MQPPKMKVGNEIRVVTWNIAGPNINPFEYWSQHESDDYMQLLLSVEQFYEGCTSSNNHEMAVSDIFTPEMYRSLRFKCSIMNVGGLGQLDVWYQLLSQRKAISGFMHDKCLSEKRLISMPDRMTNCIHTEHGTVLLRPSAITGSRLDVGNVVRWWPHWLAFMFDTPIRVRGTAYPAVFSRLEPIQRAKYPAITEDEEAISVPLQLLCLAIFDAILIHVLSTVAPHDWQPLKWSLHQTLHEDKVAASIAVLHRHYADADVLFIQEATDAFAAAAWADLDRIVLRPPRADAKRSQVSLILLRRVAFREDTARDVTRLVLDAPGGAGVHTDDLCVAEIRAADGRPFLLASFHGDSAGRSAAAVVAAVHRLARRAFPGHTLLFGLDANTADSDDKDPQCAAAAARAGGGTGLQKAAVDASELCELLTGMRMGWCWRGEDVAAVWTTFSARTHLQPQLHKAVGAGGLGHRRHRRLKDWILFYDSQVAVRDSREDEII